MPLLLALLPMLLPGLAATHQACYLSSQELEGFWKAGDVMIGGIIPVHKSWQETVNAFTELRSPVPCNTFHVMSYGWVQAMVFAIDEINKKENLLPNITLGFLIYDNCLSALKAIRGSLQLLTGQQRPIPNYQCTHRNPLAAIIGEAGSTVSISMARLLGIHRYPQISYFATSPLLNNKGLFPSFFRTIPSDDVQARALAQLVVHFGWVWVGLLANEDDYGMMGSQILKVEFLKYNVCVAFHESIPSDPLSSRINLIVETVLRSRATVVIAFCTAPYLILVMRALSVQNIKSKVWIASEGWATTTRFTSVEFAGTMEYTLGLAIHEGTIPGFKDFLLKVHPSQSNNDIFIKTFWELAMGCHWPKAGSNMTLSKEGFSQYFITCTGQEKLEKFKEMYQDEPDLRICYIIYNAIYAVAHALRNMISCVPGHGPFANNTCARILDFRPWQLLHYMKTVRFRNTIGEEISFDNHGRSSAMYDIINWQRGPDNAIRHVTVGIFDSRAPNGQALHINSSILIWTKQGTKVPCSVCSESCLPGYRKAPRTGETVCCYDCIACSEGEMSKDTDSSDCWQCASDQWPNEGRNDCVPKRIEFLSYWEPLGCILTAAVILFSFMAIIILCIFIKYRDTPIVKANNWELSYVLLGALVLSFYCALLFIGEPRPITCLLRQPSFGITFVLCISCMLAKTIMVVIAFNATKPGSNLRGWLSPHIPMVAVFGCTLCQILVCTIWLLLCPPYPEKNMKLKTGTIIAQCNECSETAFWCMLGYMGLLACASFLLAFLARKLPDSFNEAKWITFSMLVFLTVWLSFIPSFLSTHGKYMVAVEVFSIISSSAGILICIFSPKCYILLLRPDLNFRGHLLGKAPTSRKHNTSI